MCVIGLLQAAAHLNTQFVCHLCLSLDSVLVTQAGRLVISQFYYAQKLSDEFMTKRVNAVRRAHAAAAAAYEAKFSASPTLVVRCLRHQGASPGSSEDRICPDVLNACHAMGATGKVDVSFVGQTVRLVEKEYNCACHGCSQPCCVCLWQVWEVGVLAYEMLTGGHPLPGYPNKYGKPGSIMYSLSGVQPLPDTYPKGNPPPPS